MTFQQASSRLKVKAGEVPQPGRTQMFSAEEAEDWDWYEPAPDGTLHQMPDLDGSLPCCGRRIDSLQVGEGTTSDPDRVTC